MVPEAKTAEKEKIIFYYVITNVIILCLFGTEMKACQRTITMYAVSVANALSIDSVNGLVKPEGNVRGAPGALGGGGAPASAGNPGDTSAVVTALTKR